jgi:hypothetical protein
MARKALVESSGSICYRGRLGLSEAICEMCHATPAPVASGSQRKRNRERRSSTKKSRGISFLLQNHAVLTPSTIERCHAAALVLWRIDWTTVRLLQSTK